MRIVYVTPVAELGGAERCLLNVMASVHRTDSSHELHLISASDGPVVDLARDAGIATHVVRMPAAIAHLGNSILQRRIKVAAAVELAGHAAGAFPQARRYLSDLRRAIRTLAPDLVHTNGLKAHLMTSLAGVGDAALVWHIHDFLGARPAMGRALRVAARRAAGAIAISQAVAADTRGVLPRTPVEVVYNAIDVRHFTPAVDGAAPEADLDALAGMPHGPQGMLRVGLVATYARWKGQDLLLEAARQYTATGRGVPVRFYIIGGPIYRTHGSQFSEQELRRKAAALGIADRVGFIGFQRDTRSIYRSLDVVVHASTEPEPFGLTIVEAMACGRAVIVSNAGGAAELFTHGQDAIGVTPRDPQALATAIGRLVGDAAARTEMGHRAYLTTTKRFSTDRLGGEMLNVYNRMREER